MNGFRIKTRNNVTIERVDLNPNTEYRTPEEMKEKAMYMKNYKGVVGATIEYHRNAMNSFLVAFTVLLLLTVYLYMQEMNRPHKIYSSQKRVETSHYTDDEEAETKADNEQANKSKTTK